MVTVLGCVESQQFCNPHHPDGPTCAVFQTSDTNTDTWEKQAGLECKTKCYCKAHICSDGGLFRAALSLPPNQWELGVENWFATGLAALQRRISKYVTGEGFEAANAVLGLFLIILPGLVIIRITLTLVSVVHRLQPNTELNAIRQLEWERTETLELQRQLFAAKGVDIEAVSENGRQRINGTDVESPYTTKSEAPTGLPLDSSGGKQGVSAHYAEVDESRSTSAFEPVDQGDDIADPINRYANNPEDHEMTRLGSGSSRYRRLL
ncbi:hypothetical protein LTR94_021552 [Friedmanniomyces endolithicus]|nr:hypothetical protein LTR94_021552 [Friedmanniomyces endolithicus]KAK0771950.1 hypothetical protein LTR38_017049 [Friedmanniomyces endolithicus]